MKEMLSKLKGIFIYYDSEPMEILQGVIWLFIFPTLHIVEHGINLFLIIPSILIGIAIIKAVCCLPLFYRKNVALAAFLFSVVAVTTSFLYQDLPYNTMHWMWVLISVNAIVNLNIIANRYYNKTNGCDR